jgi:hypothetical protein
VPRRRGGVLGDPRDTVKAGLLEAQSPVMELRIFRKLASETGTRFLHWRRSTTGATSENGTMPNEGIKGDEWAAYITL